MANGGMPARSGEHPVDQRTVFVRNLAYSVTKEKLEEAFSEVGPVRSCFLVQEKGSEHHKGFGFVQFALAADAELAVTKKHGVKLDGRAIRVEVAKKRAPLEERKQKKRARQGTNEGEEDPEQETGAGEPAQEAEDGEATPAKKQRKGQEPSAGKPASEGIEDGTAPKGRPKRKRSSRDASGAAEDGSTKASQKQKRARTVVIAGLSSAAGLEALLTGLGCKVNFEEPPVGLSLEDLQSQGLAKSGATLEAVQVVVDSVRAARQLVAEAHEQKVGGRKLWARQLGGEGSKLKKWRLIVRNLPYQVDVEDLRKVFSAAGFVWELTVPLKADNKSRGFAFVGYTCKADAEKAVRELNGAKVGGRPVAVDWAVSKREFEAVVAAAQPSEKGAEAGEAAAAVEKEAESSEDEEYDFEGEKADGGAGQDEGTVLHRVLEEVLGEKEELQALPEDEQPEPREKTIRKQKEAKPAAVEKPKGKVAEGSKGAQAEGTTVFVRNLPADVSSSDVQRRFSAFGPVSACRLVLNRATGRPKGTAFLEFATPEAAAAAAAASKKEGGTETGIMILGKAVLADLAVGKEEAKTMAMRKAGLVQTRDKDRRNLYLAEEGAIPEGSAAAAEMSGGDQARRARLAAEKRTKLRSPNFSVSATRLAVHNLPPDCDEKRLKQIFLEAVRKRATKQAPHIKQAKVLRDTAKGGKSRGAGFVEFTEHQHALVALRALNNNPTVFTKDSRPIVEFAIENQLILRKRQVLQAKAKGADPKAAPPAEGKARKAAAEKVETKVEQHGKEPKSDRVTRKGKKKQKQGPQEAQRTGGEIAGGEGGAAGKGKGEKRSTIEIPGRQASSKEDSNPAGKQNGWQKRKEGKPSKKEIGALDLPDGEYLFKGFRVPSRRERKTLQSEDQKGPKKVQDSAGGDRLDALITEYKQKYFQVSKPGVKGSNGAMQASLKRWFE